MAKSQAFVELMDIITPVVREGGSYDKIVGAIKTELSDNGDMSLVWEEPVSISCPAPPPRMTPPPPRPSPSFPPPIEKGDTSYRPPQPGVTEAHNHACSLETERSIVMHPDRGIKLLASPSSDPVLTGDQYGDTPLWVV